jgi:hypothetical protein
MKTLLPASILFISLLSFICSTNTEIKQNKNINAVKGIRLYYDTLHLHPINKEFYFPTNLYTHDSIYLSDRADTITFKSYLKPNNDHWQRMNEWYSEALMALKEPKIYNLDTTLEIYRFTWLRTFHKPVAIRIENNNNKYKLFLKISDGAGGYSPGKLIVNENKILTYDEWNIFKDMLSKINFWQLVPETLENMGNDGAGWILEGKTKDKYNFMTIWNPNEKHHQDFRECCEYLINLSKLKIKKSELY